MIRSITVAAVVALSCSAFAETRSYDVKGMTCAACVKSVKKQMKDVCEAKDTTCDVQVGKVTVTGTKLDDEAVKAAVSNAGFEVVGVEHADAAAGTSIKPAPGPTMNTKSKSKTK